jgi:hypothetical protein
MPVAPPSNPDYNKQVVCQPVRTQTHTDTGFPLVWANSSAPILFFLCLGLIAYFSAQIVFYIRGRKRS